MEQRYQWAVTGGLPDGSCFYPTVIADHVGIVFKSVILLGGCVGEAKPCPGQIAATVKCKLDMDFL